MCLNPIVIKTVDAFNLPVNQSVPCGKCIECFKDRQNSWKIRLQEESRDHKYVYFFTLTYSDDHVPFVISSDGERLLHVSKPDVQKWIKRNRISYERYFGRVIDLKYFVCSEYGPNTGRPHYHGVLFTDISPTFITSMFNDWKIRFGFTNFSEVGKSGNKKTKSRISSVGNYVAKYCAKPPQLRTTCEQRTFDLIFQGVIPAPFYLMSKGIGLNYVKRSKRYHVPFSRSLSSSERVSLVCDRSFYHDGAFKYKLPRYYRDRLYRRKFPYDVRIWNKKLKCYEEKVVWRYASKNPLAIQMQTEVRNRLLSEYDRRVKELSGSCPAFSRTQIDLEIVRADSASKMDRCSDIFSKMSRFYNFNRFKNRKL